MIDKLDSIGKRKDAFFTWLASQFTYDQIFDLKVASSEVEAYCRKEHLVSIYSFTDKTSVNQLRNHLESDSSYKFIHYKSAKQPLHLIECYGKYLSYIENLRCNQTVDDSTEDNTCEQKDGCKPSLTYATAIEKFRNYLKYVGYTKKDIPEVIEALWIVEDYINNSKRYNSLIFAQSDYAARDVYLFLLEDTIFSKLNIKYNRRCSGAITLYIRMLKKERVDSSKLTKQNDKQDKKITQDNDKFEAKTRPTDNLSIGKNDAYPKNEANEPILTDEEKDPVIEYATIKGLTWVDKRQQNGCLWLICDRYLDPYIRELHQLGFDFQYARNGSKSTGGKPGWFLCHNTKDISPIKDKPKVSEESKTLSHELQVIIAGDEYEQLRTCLLIHDILTLERFKSINLWDFMNKNNLYSIGQRQYLCRQIIEKFKLPKKESEDTFELKTQTKSYRGESPAVVFALFCEAIARKFPLKIRSLLNEKMNKTGPIVLSRVPYLKGSIALPNPVAYIRNDLTMEEALLYGRWICKKCGEDDEPVAYTEPHIPVDDTSADKLKQTVPEREIDNTPELKPIQPKNIQSNDESADKLKTKPEKTEPCCTTQISESQKQLMFDTVSGYQQSFSVNQKMVEKAEQIVLAQDLEGMTIGWLSIELGTTIAIAKQIVADSFHIVSVKDDLIHDEAFVDWEEGANQLDAILDKLMQKNNGYVSSKQLYEYAHAEMSMFLNDNGMDDQRKVFDIAQHLFEKIKYHGKHYQFRNNAHISRGENAISNNVDVILGFARDRGGYFTETEMTDYLQSVGIKTSNLRAQMQVYSKPTFLIYDDHAYITSESMDFSDDWFSKTNKALNNLFADMGDHVVIRDIQPWWYSQLPPLPSDRVWTPLLLQSVLMHFSNKLSGTHTIRGLDNQSGDTLHAMIVSGTSDVQTFADAVVAFIVDDAIEQRRFEAEELRQLLVKRGMVAGNELIWHMSKALSGDTRFAWDADEQHVTVNV